MRSTLSILGLYNYDNTIFDNLHLPIGVSKETIVNNLLMELAELELIYTTPGMMKTAINYWSAKELPVWEKLYASTTFDYKPLENLYRTEEYKDKETRNLEGTAYETRNLTKTDNQTRNLSASDNEIRALGGTTEHSSETSGTTTNNGTDTQKNYVLGFNSAEKAESSEVSTTLGSGNTVSGTVETIDSTTDTGTINKAMTDTGTVNNTMQDTGSINNNSSDTGTVEKDSSVYMHGSIGVITPQQMIEQERRVALFNVSNFIIDSFKTRFCILIY